MSTSAALQSLLALSTHTCCRATLFRSRVRQGFFALFLALVPVVALAQVGREFVTVEAYVGRARVVHVGKILEIKQIEYGKPLEGIQKLGKPYKLVFQVSETIRGDEVKRLELVLALQSTSYLEYMRDHFVEVMLVGGPTRGDSYRDAEIGVEEAGKRVDDERYQFRLLNPVEVATKLGDEKEMAVQVNLRYDSCRMFTNELGIVVGREAILKRARTFAKQHPEMLSAVSLPVPNEFGALCADPNAFCTITLPICPETKTTLVSLKNDPGHILRRIESRDGDANLALVLVGAHKALAAFPVGSANLPAGQPNEGALAKKVEDEGVKGIWHGTICSREVQLKKLDGVARAPRPSKETVLFRSDWKNGNRAKVIADLVALLKEGMTKDQVASILERPFRQSDGIAQDGNSEKWTFTITLGRILILTFDGEKLITIDGG